MLHDYGLSGANAELQRDRRCNLAPPRFLARGCVVSVVSRQRPTDFPDQGDLQHFPADLERSEGLAELWSAILALPRRRAATRNGAHDLLRLAQQTIARRFAQTQPAGQAYAQPQDDVLELRSSSAHSAANAPGRDA